VPAGHSSVPTRTIIPKPTQTLRLKRSEDVSIGTIVTSIPENCKGQVALDVIDDHFWLIFVDPDHDLSVKYPGFLKLHY